MSRGFDITGIGGQNNMDRGVNILCVRGRYPMGRRLDIPWLEESSAMGRE
jgi:hypothetical protein